MFQNQSKPKGNKTGKQNNKAKAISLTKRTINHQVSQNKKAVTPYVPQYKHTVNTQSKATVFEGESKRIVNKQAGDQNQKRDNLSRGEGTKKGRSKNQKPISQNCHTPSPTSIKQTTIIKEQWAELQRYRAVGFLVLKKEVTCCASGESCSGSGRGGGTRVKGHFPPLLQFFHPQCISLLPGPPRSSMG